MKVIVVALALVAVAAAGPVPDAVPAEPIKILRSEFDVHPEGGYNYAFETENGIRRDETGELKEVPDEENKLHSVVIVRGTYSYTNDLGEPDTITYWADETGYHAEGNSIPKAPETVARQ